MPENPETANALLRDGKLAPAIAAANAAVRKNPGDFGARILLAELLVFANNLERADLVLDAAAGTAPSAAVVVAEFRQLLRAETARRQVLRDGRLPEFLGEPPPALRAALAARVALRAGDAAEARRQCDEAEELRPRIKGTLAGENGEIPFDDLRDADDLCAGLFEVLTTTGKYYWIPSERVVSIQFHPPRRPRDLAWRRATMSVAEGPDGEVFVPAIYDTTEPEPIDEYRLGRATDWLEEDGKPVRGIGQRVFLIADDPVGIMELATLRFEA